MTNDCRRPNAPCSCGTGIRSHWITDALYQAFRADVAIWNAELVPRLATWHRADAGYFLLGLAHTRDPFSCLPEPGLVMHDPMRNVQTTHSAIINVRVCESADQERLPPAGWIAFARQHQLEVNADVVAAVAVYSGGDPGVHHRTLGMLHKMLGAALRHVGYEDSVSDSRIIEELNAVGAGIDRKKAAPHIKAARAAISGVSR